MHLLARVANAFRDDQQFRAPPKLDSAWILSQLDRLAATKMSEAIRVPVGEQRREMRLVFYLSLSQSSDHFRVLFPLTREKNTGSFLVLEV